MKPLWQDTDPDTEAELIRRLRDASPARRFDIAEALSCSVISFSRRALARKRPEASEIEIWNVVISSLPLHQRESTAKGRVTVPRTAMCSRVLVSIFSLRRTTGGISDWNR